MKKINIVFFVFMIFLSCSGDNLKNDPDLLERSRAFYNDFSEIPKTVNLEGFIKSRRLMKRSGSSQSYQFEITGNRNDLTVQLIRGSFNDKSINKDDPKTEELKKEIIDTINSSESSRFLEADKHTRDVSVKKTYSQKRINNHDCIKYKFTCMKNLNPEGNYNWLKTKGYYWLEKNTGLIIKGKYNMKDASFFLSYFPVENSITETYEYDDNNNLKKTVFLKVFKLNAFIYSVFFTNKLEIYY